MLDAGDGYESLSEGRTIAELLEAQGVTLEDIIAALKLPRVERSQRAEEDTGDIQEQTDEKDER